MAHAGTSWGDPGDALGRMLWAGCSSNPLLPHPKQFGWGGKGGVASQFWKRSLGFKGMDGAFDICVGSARLGGKCGIEQLALNRQKKLNDTGCN